MRLLLLLVSAAALSAPAAQAADWSCTGVELCRSGEGCSEIDPEGEAPLALVISDDGQTATLGDEDMSLPMTLIQSSDLGRTFLAEAPGQGIGLFTLREDGSVVATSHEMLDGTLIGVVSRATCTAEAG